MPFRSRNARSRKIRSSRSKMHFKISNKPPRRKDIMSRRHNRIRRTRKVVSGGSYGSVVFPASSYPASTYPMTIPYNVDPNWSAISASTRPDILTGVNPANYDANTLGIRGGKRKRKQKGGNFQQAYLNSLNSISQLTNSGVSNTGILHPPLITDITGVSSFANGLISGPQVSSLTSTNPPLA
jgi:hypothetical protein